MIGMWCGGRVGCSAQDTRLDAQELKMTIDKVGLGIDKRCSDVKGARRVCLGWSIRHERLSVPCAFGMADLGDHPWGRDVKRRELNHDAVHRKKRVFW